MVPVVSCWVDRHIIYTHLDRLCDGVHDEGLCHHSSVRGGLHVCTGILDGHVVAWIITDNVSVYFEIKIGLLSATNSRIAIGHTLSD